MLAALALTAVLAATGPPAVIRTGGPSAPGDPKVAVVAWPHSLTGQRFRVVDRRGRTVLRGRLREAAGSPAPWRFAASAILLAAALR